MSVKRDPYSGLSLPTCAYQLSTNATHYHGSAFLEITLRSSYAHVYIHAHTHGLTHVHAHASARSPCSAYTHVYTCLYTRLHTCRRTCPHACIHTCLCTSLSICLRSCRYACLFACPYARLSQGRKVVPAEEESYGAYLHCSCTCTTMRASGLAPSCRSVAVPISSTSMTLIHYVKIEAKILQYPAECNPRTCVWTQT